MDPALNIGTLANLKESGYLCSWNAWLICTLKTGVIWLLVTFFQSYNRNIINATSFIWTLTFYNINYFIFLYIRPEKTVRNFFGLLLEKFWQLPDFKQVWFPTLFVDLNYLLFWLRFKRIFIYFKLMGKVVVFFHSVYSIVNHHSWFCIIFITILKSFFKVCFV